MIPVTIDHCAMPVTTTKLRTMVRVRTNMARVFTCNLCQKIFTPKRTDRITYCSRGCAFAHKTQLSEMKRQELKQRNKRSCLQCAKPLDYPGARRYCSKACAYAYRYQIDYVQKKQEKHRCKECKRLFSPKFGNKHRIFCSDVCCKKYSKRQGKQVRRDRERSSRYEVTEFEKVNRLRVYERDKWMCRICGEPVNRKQKAPDPRAPTLDHIVPLAAGGAHAYSNVQCAHFICNSRKGARPQGASQSLGKGGKDRRGQS